MLTSKQRSELRAQANPLEVTLMVGKGGVSESVITEAENLLERHFGAPMAQLGLGGLPAAIIASGTLLQTLLFVQKNELAHIRELQYYTTGKFMELDLDARRNLELTETMRSKEKKGTLLWVLDKTHTAMGGRLLRSWLEKPLLDVTEIGRRQAAVEEQKALLAEQQAELQLQSEDAQVLIDLYASESAELKSVYDEYETLENDIYALIAKTQEEYEAAVAAEEAARLAAEEAKRQQELQQHPHIQEL